MPRLIYSLFASVVAAVAVLGTASTASAVPQDCWDAWERLGSWSVEVQRSGVSPALLEQLEALDPMLAECDHPDSVSFRKGMGNEVEIWRPLVSVYFPIEDVDRVMCLMRAESGGNPNAQNQTSGAAGLMQVLPSWAEVFGYEVEDLFDPGVNLWISSVLQDRHGWSSWSPYLRGFCR